MTRAAPQKPTKNAQYPYFVPTTKIERFFGIKPEYALRLHSEGKFPEIVTLTERVRGWRGDDLAAWFDAQAGKGDAA